MLSLLLTLHAKNRTKGIEKKIEKGGEMKRN